MPLQETLIAGAIATWITQLERATKLFSTLDAAQLEQRIAPGRNRLIYLWGHLTAVHDRMLPLLDLGERIHPEFDEIFVTSPDGTHTLPAPGVLLDGWNAVNSRLNTGIHVFAANEWLQKHTAVSDEDFAKEPLRNRFSILLSRTNHLSYHIGQAALARK